MNANKPEISGISPAKPGPAALVFSCSGAADTGEIADRSARRLSADNVAQMACLASISSRLSSTIAKTGAANNLLVLDGCPNDCAKKTLELAGFTNVKHVRVTDLGFKKGGSPASDEAVRRVVVAATTLRNS